MVACPFFVWDGECHDAAPRFLTRKKRNFLEKAFRNGIERTLFLQERCFEEWEVAGNDFA